MLLVKWTWCGVGFLGGRHVVATMKRLATQPKELEVVI